MKLFDKIKFFLAGVTATIIAGTLIFPAAAATLQQIQVSMGDIRIYVDGQIQTPTDVDGNTVEPMIYNGTTYLPVRALTGMLTDKPVAWDGSKRSVYIGTKPSLTLDAQGENLILTAHGGPMRVLNTFLSSFSEVYFPDDSDYSSGDTAGMIDFAFRHNMIHDPSKLQISDSYMSLPADAIVQTIREYFNTAITHQNTSQYTYRSNRYYRPIADTGFEGQCSIADEMYRKADGTWDVHFVVFSTPGMNIIDLMDKRDIFFLRDALNDSALEPLYDGIATLGQKEEGGYYLISYKINDSY